MTLTSTDSDVESEFELSGSDNSAWCTDNTAACDDQVKMLDSGRDDYGAYYNWYAATAGSGRYEMTSGNAAYSVCPAGWRMASGRGGGEQQRLYSFYDTSGSLRSSPVDLVLAGAKSGENLYQGTVGRYWSKTGSINSGAYVLYIDGSRVTIYNYFARHLGYSLRCLAQ